MKRIRPVLLIVTTILLTTGCDNEPEKKQPEVTYQECNEQILRLNLNDDPLSLDPRYSRSLRDLTVVKQLFEGLTRLNEESKPELALAEHVEISEDGKTYTFKLRETFWSNGLPITTQDFIYTWHKILEVHSACDYANIFYPIKNAKLAKEGKCPLEEVGISAIDDTTLVVELEYPTPYFLELTAFPAYYPICKEVDLKNKHWAQATAASQGFVSSGPFTVEKWTNNQELSLVKNQTYWDLPSVSLDRIVFSIISDNNTEHCLFEKGELDWIGLPISINISTDLIEKMKQEGKLHSYHVAGTYMLKFNTERAPFNLPKLRKAFAYAISRQEIIDHILLGNQIPATSLLPPTMSLQKKGYFKDGDSELAKKLFEEAMEEYGLTVDNLSDIVLTYLPTERNCKIVQLIQQQWRKTFGIDVNLLSYENKAFRSLLKSGQFQIAIGDWIGDFNDPITFLDLFKYRNDEKTGNGLNDTGWYNSLYSELLDCAVQELDEGRRSQYFKEAETILMNEMPIIPLYHHSFSYIKKDYVKDVLLSPLGLADFKKARIDKRSTVQ